jgi:uncharacterized protein
MRVVVAGGSGFIGRKLIERLLLSHHTITVLTRTPKKAGQFFPAVKTEFWDAKTENTLAAIVDRADAVINLAGESIAAKRWTQKQKDRILSSRIESTRSMVRAIINANHKPSMLLNASAVGYYGDVAEGEVTETSPQGKGFLADVCVTTEAEALKAQECNVRVVLLRTGIVLEKSAGVLQKLLFPFSLFIGGPLGSGTQWFPWIHVQDEVNAILFAMDHEEIDGPLNLAAPESVRMNEFCHRIGRILHRPSIFRVPAIALKLALGEMAEPLLLQGQKMIPQKLMEAGFKFQFPKLDDALNDLLH